MARGALRHEGHDPAPPCGPLLLREGWRTVVPVDNKTTVRQVALTTMGALRFGARQFLVERRCEQCREHILVYTARSQNGILHPRLLGHIPIDSELEEKRILGAIAPLLRRFKARLVGVKS